MKKQLFLIYNFRPFGGMFFFYHQIEAYFKSKRYFFHPITISGELVFYFYCCIQYQALQPLSKANHKHGGTTLVSMKNKKSEKMAVLKVFCFCFTPRKASLVLGCTGIIMSVMIIVPPCLILENHDFYFNEYIRVQKSYAVSGKKLLTNWYFNPKKFFWCKDIPLLQDSPFKSVL